MAANLTQILNFEANFHQEFELFSQKQMYANKKNFQHDKKYKICLHKTL